MNYITVTPAYGADYKSKKEVLAAWNAGKDFRIESYGPDCGRYINKADSEPSMTLNVRYQRMTKVLPIKGGV